MRYFIFKVQENGLLGFAGHGVALGSGERELNYIADSPAQLSGGDLIYIDGNFWLRGLINSWLRLDDIITVSVGKDQEWSLELSNQLLGQLPRGASR